jgi:TolB-like protein/DNA-binding winged helix-turn-helix (wHTH) protein/Flp pilus assembly protein TadD
MGTVQKYRFGPFEVSLSAREVFKSGMKIRLQGQPFQILELLLSRAGQVVSRDEIRSKLWPTDTFVDFEHGLNTSVKKLRQALLDSPDNPRYIETLPRLGYRFIAPVEVISGSDPSPIEPLAVDPAPVFPTPVLPTPVPAAPRPEAHPTSWPRVVALSLAAVMAVVTILAILQGSILQSSTLQSWWGRVHWPFLSSNSPVLAGPSARRFSSIAVLPLQNLSNDPSQEYFADGMTDELISDLAQISGLRVISRTSVMHYKGGKQTAPQVGRDLDVEALVEGTVERAGDHVRIRVQLIDAASDRHLWARNYDRELKDILALQSGVATDVAEQIQAKISPRSVGGQTVQPDAYEDYLKGEYFWNQRSGAALTKSIDYYREAIAKDPSFAAAYAGLAGSYSLLGSDVLPVKVAREKARAAATTAIQLDPNIAEGHAELGLLALYYDWDWKQAEHEFKRAIELNPNYATAHQWYSYYLRAMGRLPEALEEARMAQQLDPLSLSISTTVAGRYRDLDQIDKAIEVAQRTLELDPKFASAHEILASVYSRQGKFELALAEWKKAAELAGDDPTDMAALGYAYAMAGDKTKAREIMGRLQKTSKEHYLPAWEMAVLCTGLGDANCAFQWLDRSYRERESQLPFLNQDLRLAPLRSDPRFQNLVHRVGLPDAPS